MELGVIILIVLTLSIFFVFSGKKKSCRIKDVKTPKPKVHPAPQPKMNKSNNDVTIEFKSNNITIIKFK